MCYLQYVEDQSVVALVVVGECGLTRADMLHNLLLHYHPNESNTVSVMVGWRKATKKNSLALCRG